MFLESYNSLILFGGPDTTHCLLKKIQSILGKYAVISLVFEFTHHILCFFPQTPYKHMSLYCYSIFVSAQQEEFDSYLLFPDCLQD